MYPHKNGLTLRKLAADDLPMLLELKQDSWFGTHKIAILNMDDEQRWFDALAHDRRQLVMMAMSGNMTIGIFCYQDIDWFSRTYTSSHSLFKRYRGKKLSYPLREAGVDFGFEILNMERVTAYNLVTNLASRRTGERLGFVCEGIRRQVVHRFGRRVDSIVYGLLRDEWLASDRVRDYGGVCNHMEGA